MKQWRPFVIKITCLYVFLSCLWSLRSNTILTLFFHFRECSSMFSIFFEIFFDFYEFPIKILPSKHFDGSITTRLRSYWLVSNFLQLFFAMVRKLRKTCLFFEDSRQVFKKGFRMNFKIASNSSNMQVICWINQYFPPFLIKIIET